MRILCVAEEFPWPQVTGYRVRLSNVIAALSEVGDVDLFVALNDGRDPEPCVVPDDVVLGRVAVVSERPPKSKLARLARWCTSDLPLEQLYRRWTRARHEFKRWRQPSYDLCWFSHVDGYLALGDVATGPVVIDLDNLEDHRLRYRKEAKAMDAAQGRDRSRRSLTFRFARRFLDPVDIKRWARLQRRAVREAEVVTVCSELDRDRLDEPNVVVVRNGYELPTAALERWAPASPVLVFVGVFGYQPNSDAVWWFADEILPLIRRVRADATFHVAGRTHEDVAGLDEVDGVVLRGLVDDIGDELRAAAVSVVPLRSGGGTRVKILEAFAYGVPVVTTTVGCEGLDVADGVHLLVADDPAVFAAACLRLLDDRALAGRLRAAAHDLVRRGYSWHELRPRVAALAIAVAGGEAVTAR